jgi:hypothetical protein
MDFTSFKIYALNFSAITISTFNILEDSLTILLLLITLGYTIQKWWDLNKKDEGDK